MIISREYGSSLVVYDDRTYEQKPELREFIESRLLQAILESVENSIIVLWWDGTMLSAIHTHHMKRMPFLGLNFGTKWFLMNECDYFKTWPKAFHFLKKSYPLLEVSIKTKNGHVKRIAFNEVQIKPAGWRILDLFICVWKDSCIRVRGDGVLVVTPAGSTGYNSSAGWPLLPHESKHFILTPLLPFEPRHIQSTVYANTASVSIQNDTTRQSGVSVYADGFTVLTDHNEALDITIKKYTKSITLLVEKEYERKWANKVFLEQWFSFIG
jgi:NAD+ kinase